MDGKGGGCLEGQRRTYIYIHINKYVYKYIYICIYIYTQILDLYISNVPVAVGVHLVAQNPALLGRFRRRQHLPSVLISLKVFLK